MGREGIFLFTTESRLALSLGVEQSGHEADHSPPSIAEVKNV